MRAGRWCVWVAVTVGVSPASVFAQERPASEPPVHDVLSANPFLLISEWFNAEWEHGLTRTGTAGARVSKVDIGDPDVTYFSVRGFWRYYPDGAFEGFFFGFDAGITGLDESGDTRTVLGAGFELGYNWLLGDRRNFYVSLGAGADRLFAGDLGDASAVIPTVRLVNIGIGF